MKFDGKTFWENFKRYELTRRFGPNELFKNFLQGLLLMVPAVVTIAVVIFVITTIDSWVPFPLPGGGLLLTIGFIILVGRLASNVFVQQALKSMDNVFTKTPFVKLLYTSLKDLIEAFMGEKKRFDQPVLVTFTPGGHVSAVGFVTRQSLEFFGLHDHVAVYFPQSYNFAGNLLVFPRDQVRPLTAESSEVMAFIVSGGVSGNFPGSLPIVPEAEVHA